MQIFALIAILLVLLFFWPFLPMILIVLGVGFALGIGGILLGAGLFALKNKILGKA